MAMFQKRKRKLNNTKIELDGIRFDSRKEANRYAELKILEKSGAISDLQMQKKFVLIPKQTDPDTKRVVERECSYLADFYYYDTQNKKWVCEDVKGYRDPASATYAKYIIKRKLMLSVHGIRIIEI